MWNKIWMAMKNLLAVLFSGLGTSFITREKKNSVEITNNKNTEIRNNESTTSIRIKDNEDSKINGNKFN